MIANFRRNVLASAILGLLLLAALAASGLTDPAPAPAQPAPQTALLPAKAADARGVQVMTELRLLKVDPAVLDKLRDATGKRWRELNPVPEPGEEPPHARTAVLDDAQVKQLLDSMTVLSAPRVTVNNGQRASVSIGQAHPYVAGFTRTTQPDGKVIFEPKMETLQTGIFIDLTSTVREDRKLVVMGLKVRTADLKKFVKTPAPDVPREEDLYIQTPVVESTELVNTSAIADGSTLALSGFRLVQEEKPGAAVEDMMVLIMPKIVAAPEAE